MSCCSSSRPSACATNSGRGGAESEYLRAWYRGLLGGERWGGREPSKVSSTSLLCPIACEVYWLQITRLHSPLLFARHAGQKNTLEWERSLGIYRHVEYITRFGQ